MEIKINIEGDVQSAIDRAQETITHDVEYRVRNEIISTVSKDILKDISEKDYWSKEHLVKSVNDEINKKFLELVDKVCEAKIANHDIERAVGRILEDKINKLVEYKIDDILSNFVLVNTKQEQEEAR